MLRQAVEAAEAIEEIKTICCATSFEKSGYAHREFPEKKEIQTNINILRDNPQGIQ